MSGGDKVSTTSTTQELSPEQRKLLDLVIPAAENISNNTPQQFPGSSIAGFTGLQTAAQNNAVDTANNFLTPFADSTAAAHTNLQNTAIPTGTQGLGDLVGGFNQGAGARDFILSGDVLKADSNPYLRDTATAAIDPVREQLMEQILPGIRSGAQASGQVGSSRQGIAEGQAIGDFTRTAGNISSDIFSRGYGQGLDSLTSTLESTGAQAGGAASSLLEQGTRSLFAAPDIANLALLPSQILDAVGSTQQGMDQARLTEEANKFMSEQLMPWLIAKDVGNLAFGMPNGTTTSTATTPGPSALEQIMGLGSMIAGFL